MTNNFFTIYYVRLIYLYIRVRYVEFEHSTEFNILRLTSTVSHIRVTSFEHDRIKKKKKQRRL